MSDESILLEYLLRSPDIDFNRICHEAARNGELCVIRKLFDRGLTDPEVAVSDAAQVGDVQLVDRILSNWDFYVKYPFRYESLSETINTVINRACLGGHINVIRYVFEKDSFVTYHSENGALLEDAQHIKPDPKLGMTECTTLELAQYFASRGATNFLDCMTQACFFGDLDMLKYSVSMYQSLPPSYPMYSESVFKDCLIDIIKNSDITLLEYFSSYCYDLTCALYTSLEYHTDAKYSACCHFLVQAITEDVDRFGFDQCLITESDACTLLNYGLYYELVEEITPPEILQNYLQRYKTKCEQLKRYFNIVMPSDVFSLLKEFFVYD